MIILLKTIGVAILTFILIGVIIVLLATIQYMCWIHLKKCKHCGKRMIYKGLIKNDTESHYMFHCTHCGAWEQVPYGKFFGQDDDVTDIDAL